MFSDPTFLILLPAVFGASALQSATGIGYGVIAGPIFLVVLNGSQAFQISTAHNLVIAVLLAPVIYRRMDRTVLRHLVYGSCIGIPIGFLSLQFMNIVVLKLLSASIVALLAVYLAQSIRSTTVRRKSTKPRSLEKISIGLISGSMGGTLAMPGPVAATWMSARGWNKEIVRSTILVYFVFSYGVVSLLHISFSEVSHQTVDLTVSLLPAVIAGLYAGTLIAPLLAENTFRYVLLVVLTSTVVILVLSV